MSREEYDRRKASGGGSGTFGIISASANYNEFEETISKLLSAIQFDTFGSFQQSWSQSALDQTGLTAYRACLTAQGGFHITVKSLGKDENVLSIDWRAGPFGSMSEAPKIVSKNNVANVSEIEALLGTQPWGNDEKHFNILLKRERPNEASDLTIKAVGVSEIVYVPPKTVGLTRSLHHQVSWADSAVINQKIPPESLNGTMSLKIAGRASSTGIGDIQIFVTLDTATDPNRQMCAARRVQGTQNIDQELDCSFTVPYDSKSIKIEARNWNAKPNYVRAQVSY